MGYYTDYRITITKNEKPVVDDELEPIVDKIAEIYQYSLDEVFMNEISLWDVKWYECSVDMAIVSMLYPEYRFDVFGNGESEGNFWETTFINGMAHHREAEYEDEVAAFDPESLRPAYLDQRAKEYLAFALNATCVDDSDDLQLDTLL